MTCPLHLTARDHDQWGVDGACTYCGSISGAEAMVLIELGAPMVPTKTDALVYVGHARHKLVFHHLARDQQERLADLIIEDKLNLIEPFEILPHFLRHT